MDLIGTPLQDRKEGIADRTDEAAGGSRNPWLTADLDETRRSG
jgi:hypothetical protein